VVVSRETKVFEKVILINNRQTGNNLITTTYR
jgi:hypothetical protein